jgi:antitoxin ParD1/3/4
MGLAFLKTETAMPTMNVSLTPEMVEFVESEVASGDYVSASEVVREALRALRHDKQFEATKLRILREEVALGLDAADRGEFSERSVEDILKGVLGEHRT